MLILSSGGKIIARIYVSNKQCLIDRSILRLLDSDPHIYTSSGSESKKYRNLNTVDIEKVYGQLNGDTIQELLVIIIKHFYIR